MSAMFLLAVSSGLAHILGYALYIFKTARYDIHPNPTTWLIFAGDTLLLTILEAAAGAEISILILPITCSIGAVIVALLLLQRGRLKWPKSRPDQLVLFISTAIALLYTSLFIAQEIGIVGATYLAVAAIFFLLLTNLNTFIAFVPILREVYADPRSEHAGPWAVWTGAYSLLALVTYFEVGFSPPTLILYAYPLSCAALHGAIALLARDRRRSIAAQKSQPAASASS